MSLKIDTAVIRSVAATISAQNAALSTVLNQSKATVNSLNGAWTGAAADATISAYNSFAAKYFSVYRDMLNEYSTFLSGIAGAHYEEAEQANARKADEI